MSRPVIYKVGDRAWHCDTHGGPSRPGDMQEDRWREAMEPCEIIAASGPDNFGNITYTILRSDNTARIVADSWLSPTKDVCPPYFDRTEMWPVGGTLPLGESKDGPAKGFFVAFRRRKGEDPYALHSNTPVVPDDVERTFHARRHTLADLSYTLAEIAKVRGLHSLDAEVFARLIRDAVAASNPAPEWVLDWVGVNESSGGSDVANDVDAEARVADSQAEPVRREEPSAEAAESSSSPAKSADLATTHFRGILLRSSAEWEDPSAEGIFVGVSNERYHACPSLSGTRAAKFVKSAAHAVLDEEISARSRDIGTLVHGDILEGKDAAALGFAVAPGKTTTKDGCVTEDMVRVAKACAAAIREDGKSALVATLPGLRELSCRARCPESGLMLRCRFDLAPEVGGWAWDIKTTSSESPAEFDNSFGEFGYAVSGAHYLRVAALVGLPYRAMRYACVSTKAPHETWVKKFGPIAGCDVVRYREGEEWIEVNVFELATAAAVNAAKAEAHGRATGQYPKRRHEPDVVAMASWHITALRQAANGTEVPY